MTSPAVRAAPSASIRVHLWLQPLPLGGAAAPYCLCVFVASLPLPFSGGLRGAEHLAWLPPG